MRGSRPSGDDPSSGAKADDGKLSSGLISASAEEFLDRCKAIAIAISGYFFIPVVIFRARARRFPIADV